jgi:transposase-like protein
MNCIHCNNKKLYQLSPTQVKCSRCKRKFSLAKVQKEKDIQECFFKNASANECAKALGLNYITVSKAYMNIRKQLALELETEFNANEQKSYDEYIYIEKSKIKKGELYKAKDIITFIYGKDKVYNLLLPELTRYAEAEQKELKRFLGLNKIESKEKDTTFARFWNYFEEEIVKYKGVSDEYFFYYLKEIEWKFNNQ